MSPLAWLGRLLLVAPLLLAHVRCENVFGIVGENFTLPAKIDYKPVEILWTKNKDKVAEWEGHTKMTYFNSLRNRGLLNKENGHLTIFNLQNNDAGTYVLKYVDSLNKNYNSIFILSVLAPPSEPDISCNVSGDHLVLKCTANFQEPLKYTWKFSNSPVTYQTQEVPVPRNADASEKATCVIKFSQTEKSSEISLTQCFLDTKGDSYHKRNRYGLIVVLLIFLITVGIGGFLYRRDSVLLTMCSCLPSICNKKSATRNDAQRNSPVHGSGEHKPLHPENSQEQPSSERDEELNQDSALKDKQMVNDGVKPEDTSKEESSSLQDKHVDDHDVNEGEATQGAEDGSKKDLSNSPSCHEEDTKS